MADILKLERSLDEAILSAMLAVEAGRFSKVITLLEYVVENKTTYDAVMVNYALLISYMNSGDINMARNKLEVLKTLNIENSQITDVIKSITKEVEIRGEVRKKSTENLTKEALYIINEDDITLFMDNNPNDGVWKLLFDAKNGDKTALDLYLEIYKKTKRQLTFFNNALIKFTSFNEKLTPLVMYNYLIEISENPLFWYLLKEPGLKDLFLNENIPLFGKQFFLERRVWALDYGMHYPESYLVSGEVYDLMTLKPVLEKSVLYAQSLTDIFIDADVDYSEEIFETVTSVFKIILIESYPKDDYPDIAKLYAVGAYIISDLLFNRTLDDYILDYTKFSFEDVKFEILKYETLITFLLS